MPYTRHWIIEGKYLGRSEAKKRWIHEQLAPPIGHHFFCAHCGRLWAQCPVDGQKHMVWAKPCPDHSLEDIYSHEVAGSLTMEWEKEFMSEMPPKVIQWELACHLRWATLSGVVPSRVAEVCKDLLPHFNF